MNLNPVFRHNVLRGHRFGPLGVASNVPTYDLRKKKAQVSGLVFSQELVVCTPREQLSLRNRPRGIDIFIQNLHLY